MKIKNLITFGLFALTSVSISANTIMLKPIIGKEIPVQKGKVKTLIIGPKRPDCISIMMNGPCYQVKNSKSQKEWENFPYQIKGFKYKPGYEYVIQVRVQEPKEPLEGATEEYVFVKLISKKKSK